jgi:hypothetical protein
VVYEKSVQNHQVLLALPPHHWNTQVKPEGDNDIQEHEDGDGMRAQDPIHDDM